MADKSEKKAVDAPEASATKVQTAAPKSHFDFTSLNSLAVVSLATAVTGFGAVAGVITGHIALKQIQTSKQSGRALALAGVITGYVFIGLGVIGFIAGAWARGRGYEFGDHMGQTGIMPYGDQNGMMNFDGSQMRGGDLDGQMGGQMGGRMDDMGSQMGWGQVDVNPDQNATPTPTN